MNDFQLSYEELQLRIRLGAGDGYRVEAVSQDGARASGTFRLPVDETQLDNFVLQVGQPRRSVRKFRSPQMERAKDLGGRLFEALVAGDIRDLYRSARSSSESRGMGLRVTLDLTGAPTLMSVPWEFLFERPRFLAQSIYTPLVRTLDLRVVRRPHPVAFPLRILGVVSRPKGVSELDVDGERRKLADALAPLTAAGHVTLEWLPRATLSDLNDAISRPDEIHVLHYIGHGAYDERTESGILVLEDEEGLRHEVTGEEIGSLLQDERSLRLVVLNSCEGARTSHVDPFSGVASSLVEFGIPAVIGMQFEITDQAALTFAGSFYKAIVQGYPVDAALAQVRKAIFAANHDVEFGTPVLFLTHTQLFDLRDVPTPPIEQVVAATSPTTDESPDLTGSATGSADRRIVAENRAASTDPRPLAGMDASHAGSSDPADHGWTKASLSAFLSILAASGGRIQAEVFAVAIENGGTVSRAKVYELGGYEADRSLRGFTRPVNRVVMRMKERGEIPEDAIIPFRTYYDPEAKGFQPARAFKIPPEIVELWNG